MRRTSLERSAWLSERAGRPVYLKLENQQRTGSFKLRGALNAVESLAPEERARGVVTASAGNHGLGVALAAAAAGVAATVFVPESAAAVKRERIAALGADLRLVAGGYDAAHHRALEHAAATGAPYLHAYSDPAVVAGQGTVGLEILEELPGTRTLLVPVGGGGLIGGMGLMARALGPAARVVGVQTPSTSAMHDSLRAGALVPAPAGATICEGLEGDTDERSVRLASRVVDSMLLVDEVAVARAVRALFLREGVVAEPSGAVGVAALAEGLLEDAEGPIVIVVTGGNADAALLGRILLDSSDGGEGGRS